MFASQSFASSASKHPALPEEDVDELGKGGLAAIFETLTTPSEASEDEAPAQLLLWDRMGKLLGPVQIALLSRQSVLLHVYDLRKELRAANHVMAAAVGGAFHVGVECFGSEWSYGVHGVCADPARAASGHVYYGSVYLGRTSLDSGAFALAVHEMCKRWLGAEYQLFGHNCCNFADEFCARLRSFPVPAWVSTLPRQLQARTFQLQDVNSHGEDAVDEFSLDSWLQRIEDAELHQALQLSLQESRPPSSLSLLSTRASGLTVRHQVAYHVAL
mmetsp:Transcript_86215/g.152635  ORF Transcript_86215/g.152635 Transcript_86215/m.152635 type:complete len:273 (-) Transcript_86215:101-919(-)|eukprot:CAMPEP_0197653798 /NCGR_PEP_ID=MMETSP1338-20131121/37177_1 /TAXON_ID=43686 ORGANISM="Pelagodinium beii, Strain RCC1491" /NCGR_SAMPLE_ID=MMETSP1338 /ASSEMBLY_ACC=CAM_ASM_000754 /LENGTH=272 /DNA_ID=CAMNT_0043229043 /DNA_START=78 /DNA_END=896 /DNA_ORIENTATION=+